VRSSRPGAPGHAPLVDFCNRNDLQARPNGPRNPITPIGRSTFAELLILRDRSTFRRGPLTVFYAAMVLSNGSRGFTGQGPFGCIAIDDCFAGLLLNDRSLWRLRPNPIGSNTSCRATRVDYDKNTVIESSSAPAKSNE